LVVGRTKTGKRTRYQNRDDRKTVTFTALVKSQVFYFDSVLHIDEKL
jgi:hypothetical protein